MWIEVVAADLEAVVDDATTAELTTVDVVGAARRSLLRRTTKRR